MLVIGKLRQFVPCFVLASSVLALPLGAQQSSDSQSKPQATGEASLPAKPEPKALPSPTKVDYSKPARVFPNPLKSYTPRTVDLPVLTNTPRIHELMRDGKIYLSMNDAIALALADNLDLAIARYNLPIADTDLLITSAGGSPRGVSTGLVQGTPGGGVGGIGAGAQGAGAGGTAAGAGGAGAGASGQVLTTSGAGPQPDNFDPVLQAQLSVEHASTPQSSTVLTGTASALQNSGVADFSYLQGFITGTTLRVDFNNNRFASNSLRSLTNPTLSSNFRLSVRQHLLQGFGPSINGRLIVQAKNTKKIAEAGFRNQVIVTVSQIQLIYWDLVNAYEDVRVKERTLALAQKTLADNKKQVEIGTLAPIEIVRAQSAVAQDEQDLLTSKITLQLQQLTMKNAITRSLSSGSDLAQAEVVPTDTIQVPEQDTLPGVKELIQTALDNRSDYYQQKINLKNSAINLKGANNGLLPTLDLIGFYGAAGLAGVQNPLATCATPASTNCLPIGAVPTTGFGDAFSNLFNSSSPDKGVQLTLTINLRNRAAQATQVRSQLEFRQAQLNTQQLENQIGITVRNDQFSVQQNRARVVAASEAERLATQTLDAEQKKYALGSSTYFNVLSAQRDLAQAESNVVSAKTSYAKSLVQLDRDTAQTLERNNISLEDAVAGEVRTQPKVPGLAPNTALQEQSK
ncbi:MAG TPA: TolC family protein [Candidatus Saccharimonadales bacterium]|nr:TolC family protein [Candidatus Saccharimonadales bacterium]